MRAPDLNLAENELGAILKSKHTKTHMVKIWEPGAAHVVRIWEFRHKRCQNLEVY